MKDEHLLDDFSTVDPTPRKNGESVAKVNVYT